eukprot:1794467-Rhodomonas_salina.5
MSCCLTCQTGSVCLPVLTVLWKMGLFSLFRMSKIITCVHHTLSQSLAPPPLPPLPQRRTSKKRNRVGLYGAVVAAHGEEARVLRVEVDAHNPRLCQGQQHTHARTHTSHHTMRLLLARERASERDLARH